MHTTRIEADQRSFSDPDGNTYFILFCTTTTRLRPEPSPGHAYVVWGTEDNSAQRSDQFSAGFYPDPEAGLRGVFGAVPGVLKEEALTGAFQYTDLILQVTVDRSVYEETQVTIDDWVTEEYNLAINNCIEFMKAVASQLDVPVPDDSFGNFPGLYMTKLIVNYVFHSIEDQAAPRSLGRTQKSSF